MVYVEEGDMRTCITLDSDRQMRRLGEGCDLARGEPNHIRAIPSVSRLGEANALSTSKGREAARCKSFRKSKETTN